MVRRNRILHCSLFAAMVGMLAGADAYSAVRIGNATKNNFYEQQVAEQQRIAAQMAAASQAKQISGTTGGATTQQTQDVMTSSQQQLAACSRIYPNGEFDVAQPTAGVGAGGAKTCVAVVELRGFQMGVNGADAVLARANVAAGTTINCNISDFPASSYTLDAENVIFPADAEPTIEDVKKVMNQEQKQNAGMKIAAATLVGAIGGNIAGKNDIGNDSIIGTDKGKIKGTVIGALGGAAIGTGGAFAGKVGGDMIMSTGINAAAGGIVGNIMAAGDSVLRIEKCAMPDGSTDSCLWGYFIDGTQLTKDGDSGALCTPGGDCKNYFIDLDDGVTVVRCDINNKGCTTVNNLISIEIGGKPLEELARVDLDDIKDISGYRFVNKDSKEMERGIADQGQHTFGLISSAKIDNESKRPAVIVRFKDSAFGKKREDWRTWQSDNSSLSNVVFARRTDGSVGAKMENATPGDFYPMYVSAESGGIIDLGNKARLKSTLIGAGAGGAIGAFTGYQGAQSDIDERWVSAVREYKDSLQKFYCFTGDRFLSFYNDEVYIPRVSE